MGFIKEKFGGFSLVRCLGNRTINL